jgi:hypothetical protein
LKTLRSTFSLRLPRKVLRSTLPKGAPNFNAANAARGGLGQGR